MPKAELKLEFSLRLRVLDRSPSSPPHSNEPSDGAVLNRSALKARDALVLEHLPLADAIASVMARRLFPLVEREDLIQVAREALIRSAPLCRAGEPAKGVVAGQRSLLLSSAVVM